MNSLSDILNSLCGKRVHVRLPSGDDVIGTLSEVLTDALIINTDVGLVVVVVDHITMIRDESEQKKATVGQKPF